MDECGKWCVPFGNNKQNWESGLSSGRARALMDSRYTRRLQKELADIQKAPPVGVSVEDANSLHKYELWQLFITR